MSFTENFVELKKQKGLSNYQLAKSLDCSQTSIKSWLAGTIIPRDRGRQKIADYFGITLEELDGDELPVLPPEGAKKAPATEGEGISVERKALLDIVYSLTDEQCRKLLGVVLEAKKLM